MTNDTPENISAALARLGQNGLSQVDLNQHDSTVLAVSLLAIGREATDDRGLIMNRWLDIIGGLEANQGILRTGGIKWSERFTARWPFALFL